jgi:hypothetical protein
VARLWLLRQNTTAICCCRGPRCLVPAFDGANYSRGWKEALWDRYYTAAPQRQRRSVERYNIVKESLRTLARRHGINPKTVAKWRKRSSTADHRTGPTVPKSTLLSIEQEAIIVAFRRHMLLPLDDCLYALQATIPELTRSSLHRCLQRMASAACPRWKETSPKGRSLTAIPSATSISIWPRCVLPKVSSISSSPSTDLEVRRCRTGRTRRRASCGCLP